jgi:midasin (ATPase involved in ribosome maturation)
MVQRPMLQCTKAVTAPLWSQALTAVQTRADISFILEEWAKNNINSLYQLSTFLAQVSKNGFC